MSFLNEKKYSGCCLCESILIQTMGEPKISMVCYCIDCRKGSGHLGQFIGMYDSNKVKIINKNGEDTIKEYIVTSTQGGFPKKKKFCSKCGTTILTIPMKYNGNISMVRTTLLDSYDSNFIPEKALFEEQKSSYLKNCESIYF